MPETNLPAIPKAGIAPPPEADMTPSQPLQADAGAIYEFDPQTQQPTGRVFSPVDLARQNERELKPLITTPSGTPAAQVPTGVQAPHGVVAAGPAPLQGTHQRPADLTRPAASDDEDPVTARPSRGIPGTAWSAHRNPKLASLDVDGGFGGPGEYFALDGREIAETVKQLMDELAPQLDTDLRFSLAASYPRYSVKLQLIVEAEAGDQSFEITMLRSKEAEPEEIAMQHADKVVFVLKRERREFDDQGEVETPPDALREQLGLQVPGRRIVTDGKFGPLMADLPLGF